jgi:long-chain fatty acid transport protein
MFDRPTFSAGAVYIDPDVNITGKSPYRCKPETDNIAPTHGFQTCTLLRH